MLGSNDLVLVTGISGFIAQHVAVALLREGYRVRGTVRSVAKVAPLRRALISEVPEAADHIELVEADLLADAGWAEAALGCRYILHLASPFPKVMPQSRIALVPEAEGGTVRVLRAAAAAGTERTVVTSSIAAIVYSDSRAPVVTHDETDWSDPAATHTNSYLISKLMAERAAWDFVRESGTPMQLATICPGFVMGPLIDASAGTSATVIADMLGGKIPAVPRVGYMVVDVRDVAQAHIRAMLHDAAAGERFACVSEYLSMQEIGATLARKFPDRAGKIPKRTLPDFLIKVARKIDPSLASVLPDLGIERHVSNAKSRAVLGMTYRSAREAVEQMGESVIRHGLI